MKVYRIKYDDFMYVKGIMFGTGDDEPFIQVLPTFVKEDAGWFEKDKAEFYRDELNKELGNKGVLFTLEEIIDELIKEDKENE